MKEIEQIKGISRGGTGSQEIAEGGRKLGNLGESVCLMDTKNLPSQDIHDACDMRVCVVLV